MKANPNKSISEGIAWHALPIRAIVSLYVTDPVRGLTETEATIRRDLLHKNTIRLSPLTWRFVVRKVHGIVIALLVIIAVVTAILRLWIDCLVVLALLLLSVGGAILQERQAKRARIVLRKREKWLARVLRNGCLVKLPASELVPGDVIVVKTGDIVPADGRLFAAELLSCCEKPLTKTGISVEKFVKASAKDAPISMRNDMIYMGTRVASGCGRAIVVATGADTIISVMARLDDAHATSMEFLKEPIRNKNSTTC